MTYRVMTVCTGNICRSPMAADLLREAFAAAGLSDVVVDSTGISDEEEGHGMDRRAKKALRAHGHRVTEEHRARQITPREIGEQDLVLPMTAQHARVLRSWARPGDQDKIKLYRTFDPALAGGGRGPESRLDLQDPWYGGSREFEACLAQLEAATPAIVAYVKAQTQGG